MRLTLANKKSKKIKYEISSDITAKAAETYCE
jgi:hypothetical protein